MKKMIALYTMLCAGLFGYAQLPQGKISYQLIYPNTQEYTMYTMWFTQNNYIYELKRLNHADDRLQSGPSRYKSAEDSIKQRQIEDLFNAKTKQRNFVWYGELGSKIVVYNSFDNADKRYCIRDTIDFVEWQLLPDTMTINKIHCQKAKGKYKGWDYTAWFAPGIPISSCILQYRGLPGLLIKVVNNGNQISLEMTELEWPLQSPVAIAPCADAPFITKKEMRDIIERQNGDARARTEELRKKGSVREQ